MKKMQKIKEQIEQKIPQDLNELINEYTKIIDDESKDIITRANAVTALGETGSVKVVPILLKVLEGEYNTKMKIQALDALKNIGDPSTINIIIKKLYDFDPAIRSKAAYVLGYFEYNKDLEELLLDEKQPEEIREIAATAMRKSSDERYRSCLIKALTLFKEPKVLKACIYSLVNFRDELTKTALVDVLNNKEEFELKEAAIEVLGEISDEQSVLSLLEQIAKESNLYSLRFKAEQAIKKIKEKQKDRESFELLDFDYAQLKKKLKLLEEMHETYKQTAAKENRELAAKLIKAAKEAESMKIEREELIKKLDSATKAVKSIKTDKDRLSMELEAYKSNAVGVKIKNFIKIAVIAFSGLAIGSIGGYFISSKVVAKKFNKTQQPTAEITTLKTTLKKRNDEFALQEAYLKQSNEIAKEFEKYRWEVIGDPIRKTLMKDIYLRFLQIEDLRINTKEKLLLKQLALDSAKLLGRKKLTPKQFDEAVDKYTAFENKLKSYILSTSSYSTTSP